jgi:hypothetical protein
VVSPDCPILPTFVSHSPPALAKIFLLIS